MDNNYIEIQPIFNKAGRLCNYGSPQEGQPTAKVLAEEFERFNQLAGRQHEVIDGIVVYNKKLEPCMPDEEVQHSPIYEELIAQIAELKQQLSEIATAVSER